MRATLTYALLTSRARALNALMGNMAICVLPAPLPATEDAAVAAQVLELVGESLCAS
jgi:hypothetical protein